MKTGNEEEQEEVSDSKDSTSGEDSSDESDDSSDQSDGLKESSNSKVTAIFIGTIGAGLLTCILLLTVGLVIVLAYSRRKQLAPKSESSSNLEEKQADLSEDIYVKQ